MSATGLFFIPVQSPNNPTTALPLITSRLQSIYDPEVLGRWTLDHKLFRETSSLVAQAGRTSITDDSVRYLQILNLSYKAAGGYVAISELPEKVQRNLKAEPNGQHDGPVHISTVMSPDRFAALVATTMGPLWTHRQTLQVAQGASYEIDDFRVRIGELRQTQRNQVRGCVVEIEWVGAGETGDADFDNTSSQASNEQSIKAFWDSLFQGGREREKLGNVKEFINLQNNGSHDLQLVRQWVELLRLKV